MNQEDACTEKSIYALVCKHTKSIWTRYYIIIINIANALRLEIM
jgi:hypothetical protein